MLLNRPEIKHKFTGIIICKQSENEILKLKYAPKLKLSGHQHHQQNDVGFEIFSFFVKILKKQFKPESLGTLMNSLYHFVFTLESTSNYLQSQ